jgi:dTDP-4-dehydrorhamnose 3,5-epimerase
MEVVPTPIEGLLQLRPRIFKDSRGWFLESYNRETFLKAGIAETFVQDNHSLSAKNTLRGLHFQTAPGQAKLIRCTEGAIWDVAVDIRPESPTFGKHFGCTLTAGDPLEFFIPVGFAHGFLVLSERAQVQYKCSNVYNAATESGIAWDDPDLAVAWPLGGEEPVLSDRDRKNQSFRNFKESLLR